MTVLDFDWRQYRVLLSLLRELGARRELTSQLGLDQSALRFVGPMLFLMGGLFSLTVLGHPPARGFMVGLLGLTAFFLIPTLVSEAADAFMNPAEASVLAHRPIRGSTYAAAKVSYVVKTAVLVAVPINLLPAFSGLLLAETRWFYPVTHLLAVVAAALFTALLACGCFGVLFRFVPIARLRAVAMWTQLVAMLAVPLAPQILRLSHVEVDLDGAYWSAIPLTWFAAMGLAGQAGRPVMDWALAAPTLVASLIVMASGASALSQKYMTRVVMLMRVRRTRARPGPSLERRELVRFVPGSPPARAAVAFLPKVAMRDWQFRRGFLQGHLGLIVLLAMAIVRGGIGSPLGARGLPGPMQMLPHLCGIIVVSVCQFLPYSDSHRAAWLFLTVPSAAFTGFVRGMASALWTMGVVLPHVALVLFGTWRWGWHDGPIFALYSLSVASFYLGAGVWLAGGLPFTKPPRPSKATSAQGVMFALLVLAAILVAIQSFFILSSSVATYVATAVFGAAASVAMWASLRVLEANVRNSLDLIVAGPTRLFAQSQGHE